MDNIKKGNIISNIVTIIIIIFVLVLCVQILLAPFLGNPFNKVHYYFKAHAYVNSKYSFKVNVTGVKYDFKQSLYFVDAEVPCYDNVEFRIYVEKGRNGVKVTDNLFSMKWSKDVRDIVEDIANEIFGEYVGSINTEIRSGFQDIFANSIKINDIPNYFDVIHEVGGDIYLVVRLNKRYTDSELNRAFSFYKDVEDLACPLSFHLYYNNTSFWVANVSRKTYGISDFLKFKQR